ncbi:Sugar phosphate isomerase/epimerase [Promicromonospora umidemergens]|uniref:Sugar phosphate isomerase/epimerase n=1 Tax=Promicromonospora umidemergens TaxID=629679 RepID=A0ABP8WXH5_9MICO|nr:sugar phosphate isomerase/epimerase family protein [Promicromonospora umidemergens]MCP2285483.1 Sugar phosphate isomerase/epimerase [Promicromonospora umidemergens]
MRTADSWPIAANMLSFGSTTADGTPNVDAPAESWRSQLQQVADLGFTEVDPTDAWLSIGELSDARFGELCTVLKEAGLSVPSVSTTRRSVIDARYGDDYLRFGHTIIDRAPELGAEVVNFGFMQALTPAQQRALWFWLADGHHDDLSDTATSEVAVRRIRELADHAGELGVQVSLEMYEDTYIGTPDLAVRFLQDVDRENVGLNPDLGNLVRLHRPIEDIPTMFEKVLPLTNFWHIKNYTRDEDPATGSYATHPTPLVQGVVNYRSVIRRALELGFEGVFVCEHYGSDSLGVAAINRDYIRGVLRGAGR